MRRKYKMLANLDVVLVNCTLVGGSLHAGMAFVRGNTLTRLYDGETKKLPRPAIADLMPYSLKHHLHFDVTFGVKRVHEQQ